jgi:hypothetical protein
MSKWIHESLGQHAEIPLDVKLKIILSGTAAEKEIYPDKLCLPDKAREDYEQAMALLLESGLDYADAHTRVERIYQQVRHDIRTIPGLKDRILQAAESVRDRDMS